MWGFDSIYVDLGGEGGDSLGETIIIKKYSNRRLYDTESSKYITIAQVSEMIKKMQDVQVVDAKTNEDVTAYILTQIVLEDAKNNNVLLPIPLLHTLIRYGDNILKEFFATHLNQTINNYVKQKSEFDDHFRKMLEFGSEFSDITRKTIEEISPVKSFINLFGGSDSKESDD